jgi:hypothetical protein
MYIQLIRLQIVLKYTWRNTWRQQVSKLRDALGGHNGASLGIHLEAMI